MFGDDGIVKGVIAFEGARSSAWRTGRGTFCESGRQSETLKINSDTLKIERYRCRLAGASSMAMDRTNKRLSGCGNKLMAVVNVDTGKVVTTLRL